MRDGGQNRHAIIVGLRADGFQPEGELSAGAQVLTRGDIDRALVWLDAGQTPPVKRFDYIPFFAAEVDPNTLLQLEADPDVVSIEEDRADLPALAQSVPLIGGTSAYVAGYGGNGWTVAIIDTGSDYTHPMLQGKMVSEACYSSNTSTETSLCPGGAPSSTAAGSGLNCPSFIDGCFHGTHVAGIAVGRTSVLWGVARDSTFISLKVASRTDFQSACGADFTAPCTVMQTSDQIAALQRVYALRTSFNIAAVNMSIGGGGLTSEAQCDAANSAEKAAIDLLRSVNIATVIASGNSGYVNGVAEPGCISTAISVGSTDKSDFLSYFSNVAPFLKLLAPGGNGTFGAGDIFSALPGGTYGYTHGTSMAAPHVAGAWAILKQKLPGATVSQVLAALQSSPVRIADNRGGGLGGNYARIRVDCALDAIGRAPSLTIDGPGAGSSAVQPFTVSGWSIDPTYCFGTGVNAVHVYLFPNGSTTPALGQIATYGSARSDIGSIFGSRFANSGYTTTIQGLPVGTYQLTAFARRTATGQFSLVLSRTISITAPPPPTVILDVPGPNATASQPFTLSGWSIDQTASTGTGVDQVHVYFYPSGSNTPTLGIATTYGLARPDVGNIFGSRYTNSGFSTKVRGLPNGVYRVNVYARSTRTGAFDGTLQRTITVNTASPVMIVDTPELCVNTAIQRERLVDQTGCCDGTGIDQNTSISFKRQLGGICRKVAMEHQTRHRKYFWHSVHELGLCDDVLGSSNGTYQLTACGRRIATGAFDVSTRPSLSADIRRRF